MKKTFGLLWQGCLMAMAFNLTACDVERPDTVLSDTVMEDVLYDYHIAKAMGEQMSRNENYKRVLYVDYVYKKHGITEARFDSSMVWFSRHPDVLSEIYKKVTERLNTEEGHIERLVALRENKPLTSLAGDSVDVWVWQRIYQLSGMPMDNRVAFTLPSDSNFKACDTLRWSVYFAFSSESYDSLDAPVMVMQIRFVNDSVIGCSEQVREEGMRMLTLAGDTLGDIKEVNGFVYYPRQDNVRPLMMNKITLMRYHARAVDSLALSKDTLASSASLKKDTVDMEKQTVKPAKPEAMDKTKKEDARRPNPSEMRRLQKTQEPVHKNTVVPRKNELKTRPATHLKQNVTIRKVDDR